MWRNAWKIDIFFLWYFCCNLISNYRMAKILVGCIVRLVGYLCAKKFTILALHSPVMNIRVTAKFGQFSVNNKWIFFYSFLLFIVMVTYLKENGGGVQILSSMHICVHISLYVHLQYTSRTNFGGVGRVVEFPHSNTVPSSLLMHHCKTYFCIHTGMLRNADTFQVAKHSRKATMHEPEY